MTEAELERLERLADLVVDRIAERLAGNLAPSPRLVGVDEVASALGVSASYVYEHAAELGGVKLGKAKNAPLRFDLLAAVEALRASASLSRNGQPEPEPAPRRRSRRKAIQRTPSGAPLLPVRGQETA